MLILILPITFITLLYYMNSISESVIIWNVYAFFDIQVLSMCHILDRNSIIASWIIFEIAIIVLLFRSEHHIKYEVKFSLGMLLPVLATLLLAFLAAFTVPYNYDSMTYHLPRIMFWIQNRSVSYFVTNDVRQLVSSPYTEYLQMETMLLSGNDKFVNMVSLSGTVFSSYFIYQLSFRMTQSKKLSYLSVLIYLSIPIVLAESISTQVDVFAAMWVILCTLKIHELAAADNINTGRILLLGGALGMCFMTKTNACIPLLVMLLWLVAERLRKKDNVIEILRYVITTVVPALSIAIWSLVRNYILCGNIIASGYMSQISIGTFDPRYMIVNLCKNIVMVSVFSCDLVRSFQLRIVKGVSMLLGVDMNAKQISFISGEDAFQNNTAFSYQQDYAGAQLLTVLFIAAAVYFIVVSVHRKCADGFMIALIIQYIVLFVIVRWQPWGGRLVISAVVLTCPFVICVLAKLNERKSIQYTIITIIVAASLFTFIRAYHYNADPAMKRLSGKYTENELYFYNNQFESDIAEIYSKMCAIALKDCNADEFGIKNIGIICAFDKYEYPALKMLMEEDTNVESINEDEVIDGYRPDVLVSIGVKFDEGEIFKYGNYTYKCVKNVSENKSYSILSIISQ